MNTALIATALIIFVLYVEFKLRKIFEILVEMSKQEKEQTRIITLHNDRIDTLEDACRPRHKSGE